MTKKSLLPFSKRRRGVYAVILALIVPILLGFGALAIDVSYLRLAQAQTQDIADAASQAALIVLRQSGDQVAAQAAAEAICAKNEVVGFAPDLDTITFGTWDEDIDAFDPNGTAINAVNVIVSRRDVNQNAVGLFLWSLFGRPQADVSATATSASRTLHVCLAMDITNSWRRPDFYYARDAAEVFLDTMEGTYGDYDMIGMSVFSGRYGWEFTPMTRIAEEIANGSVRTQWTNMETASKSGTANSNSSRGCNVNRTNNFSNPVGGCFADMPREYTDEPGTDHSAGVEMCTTMLSEVDDPTVFNAMVMLTDGIPNGTGAAQGTTRAAQGWTEPFREFTAVTPHSRADIQTDSVAAADAMWADYESHVWVVSFVSDAAFMSQMTQGQGYYLNTSDSSALADIFQDIAQSLPLAIVE